MQFYQRFIILIDNMVYTIGAFVQQMILVIQIYKISLL